MSLSKLDAIFFADAEKVRNETFDYIVVGGGAYGTAFIYRILELDPTAKILVLEKGDMLLPEHYQNLPPAYQSVFDYTTAQPWVMSQAPYNVHGQIPYLGGRALYWNAWVPQPTPAQMVDWPQDVVSGLKEEWRVVDNFIGRSTTITINGHVGDFHKVMRQRVFDNLDKIPTSDYCDRASSLDGAMAVLDRQSAGSWQRFSPVNVIVDQVVNNPKNLSVVINCEAINLQRNETGISCIDTVQGPIQVKGAKVILALGTIEPVTLIKPAFPENKLLGRNFIGHFRSQVLLRVPAEAAGVKDDLLQVAALYLPGIVASGEYHTHISCIYNPRGTDQRDDLYRVIPDPTNLDLYMDGNYVYFLLQSMAEIRGELSDKSANYISVENGITKINFSLNQLQLQAWDEVDDILVQTAKVMANGHKLEYLQSDQKSWSEKLPPVSFLRDYNLVHEAGVTWMGSNSENSVTDSWGKMHETDNLYILGGALFPTCGSWNPTYTGMAMAYRLARAFHKKQI